MSSVLHPVVLPAGLEFVGARKPPSIKGLLAGGDLIIAADGHPVKVFSDLLSYMVNFKAPGDSIILTIIRDGEEMNMDVTWDHGS